MKLREELEKRGFLYQSTSEKLFDIYDEGGQTFYFGCDPTADSLHLGNFVVFMNAVNFMKRGNKLILIIWGETGMIGDPGGRDSERQMLSQETLEYNVSKISEQVKGILDNLKMLSGVDFVFEVRNNQEFYKDMSFSAFLREVGKYITVNQMMSKETVKKRIEDPDQSISFTEFSYMLLQAYDYYWLHTKEGVNLQLASSDQRGNIVTGIELISKKCGDEVYGMTGPLILDSTGKKFGKSEGNAIWLSPGKNSPYFVYQYFMNTSDADVERYLKLFTLLSLDEIDSIVSAHNSDTASRWGQRTLAHYVVQTIFGKRAVEAAEKISEVLFWGEDKLELIKNMSSEEISALKQETGGATLESLPLNICDALVMTGLESSKGNAKKSIESGAIYLNEEKVEKIDFEITDSDIINSKVALLRKGKKTYKIILK